jgi:acetylornithine deacetylase/succinyl-diaminopimelate desuccinylase-like protein
MKNYNKHITDFIKKLISVPSVNGVDSEIEIINLIASEAKKLNLPFKIIQKDKNHPNIFIGNNFNEKTGLLLIAHVDTAGVGNIDKWKHNPFEGKIIGDKLYGRGAIDNKAGIALSLYTLKTLMDLGKLDLAKFVGVSDEEKGADSIFGARYLLDMGLNAKSAIYTYSGNDTITIGHRGQVKLWINVTGESAHSGSRGWQDGTKGANAIVALNSFLQEIKRIDLKGPHHAFPNYFFKQTIVFIEGGSTSGMVPDKARALVDARLLPNHSNLKYINLIRKLAKQFETEKIKFKIETQTNLPAAFIKNEEKIVEILRSLTTEILKKTPEIRGCGPANEGYMFINAGIPTICGFGVDGDGAHASDEYLIIKSIPKILDIYVKTALNL